MHKLTYLLIPLTLGFFSCNRKHGTITDLTKQPHIEHPGSGVDERPFIDTLGSIYGSGITIDTGDTNRIRYYNTVFTMPETTYDTSDVIVKYVCNWEEGEIETLTGKMVYPNSRFGIWLDIQGKSPDSKLFKVKDEVWIPVDWPKDIVNVYIRPKK